MKIKLEKCYLYFYAVPIFYSFDNINRQYYSINPDSFIELDLKILDQDKSYKYLSQLQKFIKVNNIRYERWIEKLNSINNDTYLKVIDICKDSNFNLNTDLFYLSFSIMNYIVRKEYTDDNVLSDSDINDLYQNYINKNKDKIFSVYLRFNLNNIILTHLSTLPRLFDILLLLDFILVPYGLETLDISRYHSDISTEIMNFYKDKYSDDYVIKLTDDNEYQLYKLDY
jgi:hypothetical protein